MGKILDHWEPKFSDQQTSFSPKFSDDRMNFTPKFGQDIRPVFGGGTTDYEKLENKPKINGVVLQGDKTNEDLKIDSISNSVLESILK